MDNKIYGSIALVGAFFALCALIGDFTIPIYWKSVIDIPLFLVNLYFAFRFFRRRNVANV